jgi:hypothetical protein
MDGGYLRSEWHFLCAFMLGFLCGIRVPSLALFHARQCICGMKQSVERNTAIDEPRG